MSTARNLPLSGVAVAEWSTGLAGAYAGRLLADAGADVVRFGGSATVGHDPELDAYLHLGKGAVAAALDELAALTRGHDVVLLELPDAPEQALLDALAPAAVVVITPWGLTGPWAGTGRPWSEFTLQVEGGATSSRGAMDSYPIATGSAEGLWVSGSMAAGAAAAALQAAQGHRVVDISLLDVTTYANNMFQDVSASITGAPRSVMPRGRLSPGVEPASDGWVGFNLASASNHQEFLILMERPEWLADDQMNNFMGRYARYAEWTEAVREWTTRHTVDELVEKAGDFRIPAAPVHDGRSILSDPQVVEREFFVDHPHGEYVVPSAPFLFGGERPPRRVTPATPATAEREVHPGTTALPFEGLKVVDLGTWWVGAYVGAALGANGADVVKVESANRIDGSRTMGFVPTSTDHWWDLGNIYLGCNFNKRDVTLDLADERGRALLVRMLEQADVLIENYAPRVLEQIGLDWEAVHRINPRLVMLRMPAFGLSGPRREMVGYAQTVEQYSGLCWRTGYPGGDPTNPSGPADPAGAANAFFALSAALHRARRTGEGELVESVLAEGAMIMASEQVLRWTSRGELLGREGNRSEYVDLQGMFRVTGDDAWVGVTVQDEDQWTALATTIGHPEWLDEAALATRAGRRVEAERLEAAVAAWCADQNGEQVVATLLAAGIPAGLRRDWRWIHGHPHLAGRGTYTLVEHPYAGEVHLPGLPYQLQGQSTWITRRPPLLGEHNHEVLVGELGVSETELAHLAAEGVIGDRPAGQ